MQERSITVLQLAKKVGVKVDIIRNMYKYQDTVPLSLIQSICEVLDCDVGNLMSAEKIAVIPPKKESSTR
ncbi:MAG: helix-turn-helix transcriptional regulator [Oscillospiraceae bacterium]|jgi:DNA-binding Xre family transcriptional regulator|nr:helix-turn-helix transcriptional regulator [Oscillospiraceae bacterium]